MESANKRLYAEYNDPAPRNRTLFLTEEDKDKYDSFNSSEDIDEEDINKNTGKIFNCDSQEGLKRLPDSFVDLVFADPPYNKGKDYGNNKMKMSRKEYVEWNEEWISEADRVLKEDGSIYVCSGWKYSDIFHKILREKFNLKNRITWEREKGRGSKSNWKNNMEDIWYAVKSDEYTFNLEDVKQKKDVKAPYRENGEPKDWEETDEGKIRYTHPANIWTDTVVPFWSMHENTPHSTQKAEMILERVIKASSNKGDIVLDPFLGSGTTAAVATKYNRRYIGMEINEEYVRLSKKRID